MLRVGYHLPEASENLQRRAWGFMRAVAEMPEVEGICFRQLGPDLGDLPFPIDGLAGSFRQVDLPILDQISLPAVSLNDVQVAGIGKVVTDVDLLAKQLLAFTAERGARQLAFYGESAPHHEHIRTIYLALQRAVLEQGGEWINIPKTGRRFKLATWNMGHVLDDLLPHLRKLPPRTVVVCSDDWYANRLLLACQRGRLPVPGKIGIIGIGNDRLYCENSKPGLSSVMLEQEGKGAEAARLLRSVLLGKTATQTVIRMPPRAIVARDSTGFSHPEEPTVQKALRLMSQCHGRKPNLKAVARASGMSLRTFHRKIKETTGKTPGEVIRTIRIERALNLLRETNDSLAEIADKAGYGLPSQLSREVREHVGMTPRAYRASWW